MMPEDALEILDTFDAIYLGAVGDPRLPDHVTLQGLLLPIRRTFGR
jgi:tartrate dehydrogenase/decarboxylase/D-malate dehydrogenase